MHEHRFVLATDNHGNFERRIRSVAYEISYRYFVAVFVDRGDKFAARLIRVFAVRVFDFYVAEFSYEFTRSIVVGVKFGKNVSSPADVYGRQIHVVYE